jgi:hypothetical protein
MIGLVIATLTRAPLFSGLVETVRKDLKLLYYVDASSVVTVGSLGIQNYAIVGLASLALLGLLQSASTILAIRHARQVERQLPAILSDNIDNALYDIYEGK